MAMSIAAKEEWLQEAHQREKTTSEIEVGRLTENQKKKRRKRLAKRGYLGQARLLPNR